MKSQRMRSGAASVRRADAGDARARAHTARRAAVATAMALFSAVPACAGDRIPPPQLVDARKEFQQAKNGIAMQLDPTDVHVADLALQQAEQAYGSDPDDPNTIDLAVIAQRKAQIAEAEAATMKASQDADQAKQQYQAMVSSQLNQAQQALNKTQQALNQTQGELQRQQAEAAEQQKKLADLEAKLKDARDTIAKIAAVKDDDRGMVITLQGEVLFQTGKWDLKAGAMAKLDQIAEALRGKEQPMVVYGFTDNVGTRDFNMDLSQKRANSVRDYLVTRGIPQDLVTAQGKGPDNPISDNGSVEGRATNR
ncbi:MAG: OmpA family protein, partial [Myxococcales bacterium]|nr:OmpA family protein [Myxococcales bacterium]